MADRTTTITEATGARRPLAQAAVNQAAQLANEIANACLMAEVHCAWQHGEFDGPGDIPRDQVMAELTVLRDTICRLGWMADRTAELLGGDVCKGGADAWMLTPRFNELGRDHG
jgi:hypothetical protein